jgi:hypothetical protein
MNGKHKFVWNGGEWVDVTGWRAPRRKFPAIHRDTSEPMVHPATGEVFDSKSRFRAVTKQHGLVEVGTDNLTNLNPRRADVQSRKKDIAQAIQMVEQGYQAPPVESLGDADWAGTRMLE